MVALQVNLHAGPVWNAGFSFSALVYSSTFATSPSTGCDLIAVNDVYAKNGVCYNGDIRGPAGCLTDRMSLAIEKETDKDKKETEYDSQYVRSGKMALKGERRALKLALMQAKSPCPIRIV